MRVIKTLAILYNADCYARSSSRLMVVIDVVVVVGHLKFRLDVLIFARANDRIAQHGKGGRPDRSSRFALCLQLLSPYERETLFTVNLINVKATFRAIAEKRKIASVGRATCFCV